MRISDWSSDVCSSDLPRNLAGQPCTDRTMPVLRLVVEDAASLVFDRRQAVVQHRLGQLALVERLVVEHAVLRRQIGRAPCRERVCQYVEILGVAVSFKKKKDIIDIY